MLSGFVFDLRNVPVVVQVISQLLPATHFMTVIKTLFLAGDNWPETIRACLILGLYFIVLLVATQRSLRKRLE
jgi:ABC-2 type transport system permease protein